MRLISLLLASLSLVSSMPLRPESGHPVIHNHYNRIPNIPGLGLKGLKEQIMMSVHGEGETWEQHQEHELGKPTQTKAPTTTTQPPVTTTTTPTNPPTTSPPTPTLFPTLAPDLSAPGSNGLPYNGGSVMTGAVKVYLVYYGSWTTTTATQGMNIINTFVSNLGLSAWWNVQTTYYQPNPTTGVRTYVQQGITMGSYVIAPIDSANGGTSLTDANVNTIISNQINSGKLPYDANGVYLMVSSSEVYQTGFCTSDCGWHSAAYVSGTSKVMKYGWVGDASTQCLNACTAFGGSNSPNGNKGADGVISVLAHEIAEAVSDPYMNAWVDTTNGYNENADKCAWNFVSTYTAPNGGVANVNFGGNHYLVQANWRNRNGGGCVLSL